MGLLEKRWGRSVSSIDPDLVRFGVLGGQLYIPTRTIWGKLVHGSLLVRRWGPPIPQFVTLWVIEPGNLSSEGCFRDPGTCLARSPRSGDRILDTITVGVFCDHLEVGSERQEEDRYAWTPKGPRFEGKPRVQAHVRISGRASSWGSLGDDTYDEEAADDIIRQIMVEAVLGIGGWKMAPIYYQVTEKPYDPDFDNNAPILRIDLEDFETEDYPEFYSPGLVAISDADDRRPQDLLEGTE